MVTVPLSSFQRKKRVLIAEDPLAAISSPQKENLWVWVITSGQAVLLAHLQVACANFLPT